jgi:hypothetical protein
MSYSDKDKGLSILPISAVDSVAKSPLFNADFTQSLSAPVANTVASVSQPAFPSFTPIPSPASYTSSLKGGSLLPPALPSFSGTQTAQFNPFAYTTSDSKQNMTSVPETQTVSFNINSPEKVVVASLIPDLTKFKEQALNYFEDMHKINNDDLA